jgi:type IV secretory pathway VirB10-like protein
MPHPTKGTAMSTDTPVIEPPAATEPPVVEGAKPDAEPLGEGGVAALKSERELRKAAEAERTALAAQLKAIEDKDKSEAQRQQEALDAARAELEALTAAKTRAEVAADKAIPTALLAGPASSKPEDVAAFADALIAFRGEQKQAPSSSAIGRANGDATTTATPGDQFAAHIATQLGH